MTTPTRREVAHAARHSHPTDLLSTLLEIGAARLEEEQQGGPLLAAFGDFCWATDSVPTATLFGLWLADVHTGRAAAPADVDRALEALEALR